MKNVLLLINQLHTGGAQKVVSRLSMELSGQYHIFLVTYNRTESMFQHSGEHIFIQLPFSENPSGNNAIARFIRFMILIFRVRKIKKQKKIDTSISFLEASNIVNVLSARKEKVILSVRSHLSSEFKDDKRLNVFKRLIRLLYNRAYRIVVPSALMKADLSENFSVQPDKMVVIYNFIDKARIRQLIAGDHLSDFEESIFRHPVLINVGRLTNPKAQSHLLPILKGVQQSAPGTKLVILGEGPLKEPFMAYAKELGLTVYDATTDKDAHDDYDVYLLGFQENPFPYLNKSTVMVSTSAYEGFPNAMIEAMACRLPVVSTDCPSGPREILAPDTDIKKTAPGIEYANYGILLPVLDERQADLRERLADWSTTIHHLLQDEHQRNVYADKALERAGDYNKETIIQKWTSLIGS